VSSFLTFAVGALLPLVPWLVATGTGAVLASVVIGAVAAVAVGTALAVFTERTWWYSALRQLAFTAVPAAVTFGIGHAIGFTAA
jgi:VIT1/CCC1 family predicted Fe2+/Mn2+ transporter